MEFLKRCMRQFGRNDYIEPKSNREYHFEFGIFHPLLLSSPDQFSDSHILNSLNDDCLREIFQYLSPLDLSNVSSVCTRFNYLANEIFPSKYKHLKLSHDSQFFGRPIDVERLQCNFGSRIQSISVETDVRTTGGIQGRLLVLRPLLSKIKVLKLKGVGSTDELYGVLAVCAELKSLSLDTFNLDKWIGKSIKRKFKKLEEIKFISIIGIADFEVHDFIVSNPQLIKLSVLRNHLLDPTKIIRSVCKYIPKLECLEIDQRFCHVEDFAQSILELNRLKYLRVLKLNFLSLPVAPLMRTLAANGIPIEHLKMYRGHVDDEAISAISQMKQIKILEFRVDGLDDERLVGLVKELPQLQELHFEEMFEFTTNGIKEMLSCATQLTLLRLKRVHYLTIDERDYIEMLEGVKKRPETIKLSIEFINNKRQVLVPRTILQENCKSLQIIEQIQFLV